MSVPRCALILFAALVAAPLLHAKNDESKIQRNIQTLRSLSAAERPAKTIELANEIRELPASESKLQLADELSHLVTEGDQGQEALQAVGDALRQALNETPPHAKEKEKSPPMPYMDLARLVRYEGVSEPMSDPESAKALEALKQEDEEIENADFTLRDLHDRKVALSSLRGKIVMVNFWATWCPPCRVEMPVLDAIQTHFQSQGVVVLSISEDENPMKVAQMIGGSGYHPVVLLDSDNKVAKQFHVEGIPRTFVFNRDGKLVAEAMDQRTARQFVVMLQKAGLQ